jgi:hypothetical protein
VKSFLIQRLFPIVLLMSMGSVVAHAQKMTSMQCKFWLGANEQGYYSIVLGYVSGLFGLISYDQEGIDRLTSLINVPQETRSQCERDPVASVGTIAERIKQKFEMLAKH